MAEVYGTTTFNIEPGVYKSVTETVPTVGDYTCIVVAKALPEDLVYELSKALWEHKDELGEAFVDMKELNPEEAISEGVGPPGRGEVLVGAEVKPKGRAAF